MKKIGLLSLILITISSVIIMVFGNTSFPSISPANHPRTIPIPSLYHLYTNSMESKGYLRCTFGVPRGILRPTQGAGTLYPRSSLGTARHYPSPSLAQRGR